MIDQETFVDDPDNLFDEILVEILEAEENGAAANPSVWYDRYPQFRADLEEFFADQSTFSNVCDAARAGLLPSFEGYEIIRELGHGGCGVVYEALELDPPRHVALKALIAAPFLTAIERARFRREARVAARLEHANILPVYETGEANGVPYFTMKLASGGPLSQSLDPYRNDPKKAAAIVARLARALHFAHQHGVLHRDLKPSNILLDDRGEVFVSDFGLVRDLTDPHELTRTQELIGTIPYMAPERTMSRVASTVAVDVYGLGCILYACLTGRPPFEGESDLDILLKVKQDLAVPPARLNPCVPRDLDAICRMCLEKDPARRYPSADDLAKDLDRFLNNLPPKARPPGPVRTVTTSMRRHPARTTVALLIAMFVTAGILGVIAHEARLSAINEDLSTANSNLLHVNSELEQRSNDLGLKHAVVLEREAQLRTQTHADRLRYAATLLEGFSRAEAIKVLDEILPEEQRQGGPSFTWSYLRNEAEQEFGVISLPEGEARSVAFSPNDKHIAVGGQKGSVHLFNSVSLKETGRLDGMRGDVNRIAFNPTGGHLVAAGEGPSPMLWRISTGVPVRIKSPHVLGALDVSIGIQDNTIVSAGRDGLALIRDAVNKTERRVKLFDPQDGNKTAAVSPDRRLAVTDTPGGLGPIVTDLDTGVQWPIPTPGSVRSLHRTPDGRLLMLLHKGLVCIVDPLHTELEIWTGAGAFGIEVGAASSLGYIAAGTKDGIIYLWDLAHHDTEVSFPAHTGKVRDLVFHAGGRILASAGADGRVRLWDVTAIRRRKVQWSTSGDIDSLALDPKSGNLVVGCEGGIWIWKTATRPPARASAYFERECISGSPKQIAVSKDGTIFAAMSGGPVVRYRSPGLSIDWRSDLSRGTSGIGLSPDGKTVWCRHRDGLVRVYNAATGMLMATWPASVDGDGPIAVHPSGKVLAIRSTRGRAHILDATTGEVKQKFEGNGHGKAPLAFSPDGRILAVVEGPKVICGIGKTIRSCTN